MAHIAQKLMLVALLLSFRARPRVEALISWAMIDCLIADCALWRGRWIADAAVTTTLLLPAAARIFVTLGVTELYLTRQGSAAAGRQQAIISLPLIITLSRPPRFVIYLLRTSELPVSATSASRDDEALDESAEGIQTSTINRDEGSQQPRLSTSRLSYQAASLPSSANTVP